MMTQDAGRSENPSAEIAERAGVSEDLLREIEGVAVDLARLAGAEIVNSLGKLLTVRYKGAEDASQLFRDPVSEVDSRVEDLIRLRLAERFPGHDILGEERTDRPGRGHAFIWAVDPVDGTTNFVNGFPLFAGSIGVLHAGQPVVGALWCSSSHALRAGIYHAHIGGSLCFDGDTLAPRLNSEVRRGLAGEPRLEADDLPWEVRKTGSAAIECAFVAAGLLKVARFERPNPWDVAGGIALVQAAGGEVRTLQNGSWSRFDSFDAASPTGGERDVGYWRQPIILGDPESVDAMCRWHAPGAA